MPRQDINIEFNTFVGGILTEANPINYPKGFTLDEQNFILERNGTRRRRRGLGEHSNQVATGFRGDLFTWRNGYTSPDNVKYDVLVLVTEEEAGVNFDYTLTFYVLDDEDDLFSNPIDSITFEKVQPPILTAYEDILIVTSYAGLGSIFLPVSGVQPGTSPLWGTVLYKIVDDNIATQKSEDFRTVEVRDFQRINPEVYTDRAATLIDKRAYNLLASGWSNTNIEQFNTDIGDYPGTSDNMNTGLDAATGEFTSSWVGLANNGTSLIPGGGQIVALNSYPLDRATIYETETGDPITTMDAFRLASYPIDTVSYAGRAFHLMYSPTSDFGETLICFSRVVTEPGDILKCYQSNDPTGRDTNILLDTDGGVIDVSLIGTGRKLVVLNTKIIIFGSKGVFELFSTEGVLRPTNIALRKISDLEVLGEPVVVEDKIFFVSNGGIYALVYNPNSSEFQALNITEATIQTLINDIPRSIKETVKSSYVDSDKTVRFLFDTSDEDTLTELIYDVPLKAWYKNVIGSDHLDDLEVNCYFQLRGFDDKFLDYPVDSRLFIITYDSIDGSGSPAINTFRAWNYSETDFEDHLTVPTEMPVVPFVETQAFLQTGYINAGDSQRYKQANYIVPSFIRTEDGFVDDGDGNLTPTNESSCNIQAYWDFADSTASGKIGTSFEAYRYNRLFIPEDASDPFDYGQSVITTKNKLLGRGRALSLRFESSVGKDCRLLGWGLGFEVSSAV